MDAASIWQTACDISLPEDRVTDNTEAKLTLSQECPYESAQGKPETKALSSLEAHHQESRELYDSHNAVSHGG